MSEPANKKPDRSHTFSPLRVFLGVFFAVFLGFVVLAYLIGPRPIPKRHANRVKCMANLHSLGAALSLYRDEHGGAYPPADKWCDVLVGLVSPHVSERLFKCPTGGKGRCDYAMNPRADRWSAPDVILLFESTGGWNQAGGLELLTTKHHEDKGCNVLFVDGHIAFVKTEDIPRLKWVGKASEKAGRTAPWSPRRQAPLLDNSRPD